MQLTWARVDMGVCVCVGGWVCGCGCVTGDWTQSLHIELHQQSFLNFWDRVSLARFKPSILSQPPIVLGLHITLKNTQHVCMWMSHFSSLSDRRSTNSYSWRDNFVLIQSDPFFVDPTCWPSDPAVSPTGLLHIVLWGCLSELSLKSPVLTSPTGMLSKRPATPIPSEPSTRLLTVLLGALKPILECFLWSDWGFWISTNEFFKASQPTPWQTLSLAYWISSMA